MTSLFTTVRPELKCVEKLQSMVSAQRTDLDPYHFGLLEELAYQHGQCAESYLLVEPDAECLYSECGRAAAAMYRYGRVMHIPGGILAAKNHTFDFVNELKEVCRRERTMVGIYGIGDEDLPHFESAGYEINKFGEEPFIDLTNLTWQGHQFEWIRRQTNFCEKHGVTWGEIPAEKRSGPEWNEIKETLAKILADDLSNRPLTHELRMYEGRFYPEHLHRRRLFLAWRDDGRIEAFVIANPMQGGKCWAFECYRKRLDSVRGVVPFLMRKIIDLVRSEGATEVSLSLVPGKGAWPPHPRSHWLACRGFALWYSHLYFMFNLHGQMHYKSRFRPSYRSRYVCVYPRSTLFSMFSFLAVVDGLRFNVKNSWRSYWRCRRFDKVIHND